MKSPEEKAEISSRKMKRWEKDKFFPMHILGSSMSSKVLESVVFSTPSNSRLHLHGRMEKDNNI